MESHDTYVRSFFREVNRGSHSVVAGLPPPPALAMHETVIDTIAANWDVCYHLQLTHLIHSLTSLRALGLVTHFGGRGEEGISRRSMHHCVAAEPMGSLSVVSQDPMGPGCEHVICHRKSQG